jgi:hypothetical protein
MRIASGLYVLLRSIGNSPILVGGGGIYTLPEGGEFVAHAVFRGGYFLYDE